MTRLDRLQLQMRAQEARITVLEAALAAKATPRKRESAPKPDSAVVTKRLKLWGRYIDLEMLYGHGRMRYTYLAFAVKWYLNPDEFCRFFSASDRRGIPEASEPAKSFYRALNTAIAELEARAKTGDNITRFSHGNIVASQDSTMRLH